MLKVWHKVICSVACDRGETLSSIPRFRSLDPAARLGGSSGLIGKRRAFYGTVGVLAGIYLNSTAARAEVEEVSPDLGGLINSISTLPIGSNIESLMDDYDSAPGKDFSKYDLDQNLIPAAVWNVHSNIVTSLDSIQDGLESKIYAGSGARFESPYYWARTATSSWSSYGLYAPGDALLLPPPQFQVASCGGAGVEHRDLDYCNARKIALIQETDPTNSSDSSSRGNDTINNSGSNVTSSTDILSSSANNQSTPLSSMPNPSGSAFIGDPLSHRDLILLGPCGSGSDCATIHIDPSEAPDDFPATASSTSPSDGVTPAVEIPTPEVPTPTPITYVDDPGLGSDLPPVFLPQPLKPIPEAPTWVMTIAGFGIMILVFRKKRRPCINAISIIDNI